MCDNNYVWIRKKNKYERMFFIKIDKPPFYIGNIDTDILNFRSSSIDNTEWVGNNDNTEIKLFFLNNDTKKTKLNVKTKNLFNDFIDNVSLGYLFVNNTQITNFLCVVCDEITINQINQKLKPFYHKLKFWK